MTWQRFLYTGLLSQLHTQQNILFHLEFRTCYLRFWLHHTSRYNQNCNNPADCKLHQFDAKHRFLGLMLMHMRKFSNLFHTQDAMNFEQYKLRQQQWCMEFQLKTHSSILHRNSPTMQILDQPNHSPSIFVDLEPEWPLASV